MYVAANRGQCSFKSSLPDITPRTDDVGVDVDTHHRFFSLGEWTRLPFTARIERAHSYRARSARKEGTWPLPPPLAGFFSVLPSAPFCLPDNHSPLESVLLSY